MASAKHGPAHMIVSWVARHMHMLAHVCVKERDGFFYGSSRTLLFRVILIDVTNLQLFVLITSAKYGAASGIFDLAPERT